MIADDFMKPYQKRGIYYVRLSKKFGKNAGKRISLKTRNHQDAVRMARKLDREAILSKIVEFDSGKKTSISEFKKEYLEYSKAHKKESTFIRDKYSLNKLIEHIGDISIQSIKTKDIDQFHTALINSGLKPSGVAITARHIRAALNQAVTWEYIKSNPYSRAKKIKIEKNPPRYYTEDELKKIFEKIKPDDEFHDLITCYLLTGLRRSELAYLEVRDIDLVNGVITIRSETSKTSGRSVPVSDAVLDILKRRCESIKVGRLFPKWKHPNAITHRWIRLMKRLKMTGRLHDLRHSFASHLAMAGEDIRTIQELMGHSDISITKIYSHLSPNHLKQSVSKLKNLHRISTGQYPKKVKD